MRKSAVALALAAGFTALPAAAQTQCARFEIVGNQNRVRYNPYEGAVTETFQVKVSATRSGVSRVRFLLLDTDGASLGQGGPETYLAGLSGSPERGFAFGSAQPTSINAVTVTIPGQGNGNAHSNFQVTIPAKQVTRAGTYTQPLNVVYQCADSSGNFSGLALERAGELDVRAIVPAVVSATISGASRATMDFATIGPTSGNLSRSLDVTTGSTLPYEVSIDSDFDGRLRLNRNDTAGIGYTMTYNNVPVVDGSRIVCSTPSRAVGRSEPFAVTLNGSDIRQVRAGTYSDVVTLTFTPRDVAEPASTCSAARR